MLALALLVLGSPLAPAAAQDSAPYPDTRTDAYYAEAVGALVLDGVFAGTGCDAGFCPDEPIDRATMAVWTVRVLDAADPEPVTSTRFADVDASHPHAAFIERFAGLGVTRGCEDGSVFCPDDSVIRAQMAVFLSRGFDLEEGPAPGFSDVPADAWYAPDVARLAASGITRGCGDGTRFCVDQPTTRAQMAVFLVRATGLIDAPALPPLRARVTSGSAPVIGADRSFDVTVEFARWVRGFDTDDIKVINGEVTSLSGSGSEYRATVQPAAPGTVVVRVRQGAARDRRGASSDLSPPLTRTASDGGSAPRVGIDTWDRDAVLAAYEAEFDRVEPDAGFTGDVDDCAAGTTSQPFRDSIMRRVNWYRKMAGLAAVTENPALTATAQRKALIMLAQGALSHTPSAEWACYTEIDYPGENLGLGGAGVGGVDQYMQDSGDNNLAVGHRQQILSPFVTQIGTGNVFDSDRLYRAANAMHLSYDWGLAPDVREVRGFVAWPPPGYVPPETVWGRWSFARQRIAREVTRSGNTIYTRLSLSGPDFSEAAVAMSDDHGPVPTRIIYRDDALVWAVDGDTDSARLPEPRDGDHCYTVTISGVQVDGTTQAPYEYAVCILADDS